MSIKLMSAVWECDLPRELTLVMLAYADHANDEGVAWPGNGRVARKARCSERQLQRLKKKLEKLGGLEVVRRGGSGFSDDTTVYRVTPEKLSQLPPIERRPKRNRFSSRQKPLPLEPPVSSVTGVSPSSPGDGRGVTGGCHPDRSPVTPVTGEGMSPVSPKSSGVEPSRNHQLAPQSSSSQPPDDDYDLAELFVSRLEARYPHYRPIRVDDVLKPIAIIRERAGSPPLTLAWWEKSLFRFFDNFFEEMRAYTAKQQREAELRRELNAGKGPEVKR